MKEFGLTILAAVLALTGQAITIFIIQKKREDKIAEEKGIIDAIRFLGEAIHQLKYYAYKKDEEQFKEFFEKGNHFVDLTSHRFHLKRIKIKVISEKFEAAYDAFGQLGSYVTTHKNIYGDSEKFDAFFKKFSESQKEFEEYCAKYLEFGKISFLNNFRNRGTATIF